MRVESSIMFDTLIYQPIYNLLVFILSVLPHSNAVLAVLVVTILVKLVLMPIAFSVFHTQKTIKKIQPEIEKIKREHKDNPHKQSIELLNLYKKHNIRPFSNFLLILIQLPVIFGLYLVFLKGGLPKIDTSLLYSFVSPPSSPVEMKLWFIDFTKKKDIILAVLAGFSQFFVAIVTFKNQNLNFSNEKTPDFKQEFAKMMQTQMKYVFPVLVAVISYTIGSIIAFYWFVNNIFTTFQELIIKHLHDKKEKNAKQ